MPRNQKQMIKNLQKAITHTFNEAILVDDVQWYSDTQKRPVTVYKVKKRISVEDELPKYEELFSCYSLVQVVLFLRDYWYQLNGWEIPTDNEYWENAKKEYAEKQGKSTQ